MVARGWLEYLQLGHHRLACPRCAENKQRARDTALSVEVTSGGGVYLCHRCGWRGGWHSRSQSFISRGGKHIRLASSWRQLWRTLGLIAPDTTAHDYLVARGCSIPPPDGDLRCSERLRHPSGYIGPALVGLVTCAVTREPLTLHRTWIRSDGRKADVNPPRLLLGRHRKQGGVIRLWPDDAVATGLAVAEGIETALAVARVYRPVWSAIDAGNLANLPTVAGIQELVIVADHDVAGLRAAHLCAARWNRAGVKVRIAIPPEPGTDAADISRAA
jgi:putative DNA primase/helicase